MMYQRLPAPTIDPGADVSTRILQWTDEWLNSPAFRDLVEVFSGPNPNTSPLSDLLAFAGEQWDFRQGRERNLARRSEFDARTTAQIAASVESLGLKTPTPPKRQEYDHLVILGGLVQACVLRPMFAAELISKGLCVREVSALGAFRPLKGDEPGIAARGRLGTVLDEISAMEVGIRLAFDLLAPVSSSGHMDAQVPNASWSVKTYQMREGLTVHLIAAPSKEARIRRANTADTYKFWAERVGQLSIDSRVLIVTSAIYVPYQGLEAIRTLAREYRCGVETIGVDTTSVGSVFQQEFTVANYLQEVTSTLRAIAAARDGCV